MQKLMYPAVIAVLSAVLLGGCGHGNGGTAASTAPVSSAAAIHSPAPEAMASATPKPSANATPGATSTSAPGSKNGGNADDGSLQVVTNPESIAVLVNKQFALPANYAPKDLVYPDVPFTFKEKIEKREMRAEAAKALESLFAAAKKAGVPLAGVSAYRSYATQKALFDSYVKKDGLEKARTYSALPGTSEHETGLAIDVAGIDGKCAAADCFAGSKEADWLARHAPDYGFIIRYPQGMDAITGYEYEPWHIRYVGVQPAREIAAKNVTLEQYLHVVPVSKQ